MKYNTRHGFGGYAPQIHPRAEIALFLGLVIGGLVLVALLTWW